MATICTAVEAWVAEVGSSSSSSSSSSSDGQATAPAVAKPKRTDGLALPPAGLDAQIHGMIGSQLEAAYRGVAAKQARGEAVGALRQQVKDTLVAGGSGGGEQQYDGAVVSMALKVGAGGGWWGLVVGFQSRVCLLPVVLLPHGKLC